jgi:hypothetical protein
MEFNAEPAGYPDVDTMVAAMTRSEDEQLRGMIGEIFTTACTAHSERTTERASRVVTMVPRLRRTGATSGRPLPTSGWRLGSCRTLQCEERRSISRIWASSPDRSTASSDERRDRGVRISGDEITVERLVARANA